MKLLPFCLAYFTIPFYFHLQDVRGGPVSEKDHTLLAAQTVAPESKKAEAVGKDSIPLIAETKVPSVTPGMTFN